MDHYLGGDLCQRCHKAEYEQEHHASRPGLEDARRRQEGRQRGLYPVPWSARSRWLPDGRRCGASRERAVRELPRHGHAARVVVSGAGSPHHRGDLPWLSHRPRPARTSTSRAVLAAHPAQAAGCVEAAAAEPREAEDAVAAPRTTSAVAPTVLFTAGRGSYVESRACRSCHRGRPHRMKNGFRSVTPGSSCSVRARAR